MRKIENLQEVISEHSLWRTGNGGKRADLSGAALRGADLSGAIIPLGRIEERIWDAAYQVLDGQLFFMAGCHRFTVDEAIAHWGSDLYPDKRRGMAYVMTVKHLQAMLEDGCLLGA